MRFWIYTLQVLPMLCVALWTCIRIPCPSLVSRCNKPHVSKPKSVGMFVIPRDINHLRDASRSKIVPYENGFRPSFDLDRGTTKCCCVLLWNWRRSRIDERAGVTSELILTSTEMFSIALTTIYVNFPWWTCFIWVVDLSFCVCILNNGVFSTHIVLTFFIFCLDFLSSSRSSL